MLDVRLYATNVLMLCMFDKAFHVTSCRRAACIYRKFLICVVFRLLLWAHRNWAVPLGSLNSRHVLNKWHLIINCSGDVNLGPEGRGVMGTFRYR